MRVVQRPAAAPRRAQRRAAAAPEHVLGAAAASNPAAQLVLGDAGEAAIADDAWSDNFGTAISVFQGYRCVRKNKPPRQIDGRPPRPRSLNVEQHIMCKAAARLSQSNIACAGDAGEPC